MNIAGDSQARAKGTIDPSSFSPGSTRGLNSGLRTWLPSLSIAIVWVPALLPKSSKIQKSASMKPRQVAYTIMIPR